MRGLLDLSGLRKEKLNPIVIGPHTLFLFAGDARHNLATVWIIQSFSGFHLSPRDVDGDHDLDIVVTAGILRQPVAIWINDGQGGFSEGDLLSHPAPSGWETHLIPLDMPTSFARGLLTPGRRSWFGLAP